MLRRVHFPGNRRLAAPQPDGQVPVDALGRNGTQGASALWRVSHGHDRKRRRRRQKEESGKERTDTEDGGGEVRGQFIERQTATLGPIATGRRAKAFESEMKKNWGKVSGVRKRVKVIRNLQERAEVGKAGREEQNKQVRLARLLLQGRQFSSDLKGESAGWAERAAVWVDKC